MRRHRVEGLHGVAALFALAAVGGCTPHSYAGIDLRPGRAPAEVQALAARAQAGDRQAQLELGDRFATGNGVARDAGRAERLYRRAASEEAGTMQIYSPPVPGAGAGRVITIDRGVATSGLAEAKARLAALRSAPSSENEGRMQDGNGQWREFPWHPTQVFEAILANLSHDLGLDPDSIGASLGKEAGAVVDGARLTTRYKATAYSCAANPARLPVAFLSDLCAGGAAVQEHVYTSGEKRREDSVASVEDQGFRIGAFLRSAKSSGLQIVDLNSYPEFREARSVGHLGFPLSARLVISPKHSRLVVIYASTSDDAAGDRVMSIVIYSRG